MNPSLPLLLVCLAAPAAREEQCIDPRAQAIVDEELAQLAQDPATRAAMAVALDPRTGEVLALGGRRGRESVPDLAARALYDPGSVMKVFSLAAALDKGVIGFEQTVSGENGSWLHDGQTIRDASAHGPMSVGDVLAFSSNIGTAKLVQGLAKVDLADALARLHFGVRPTIELPDVAEGRVADIAHASDAQATRIAYGADIEPSPLQVAAAFAAVANGGTYRHPTLLRGTSAKRPGEPVFRPETARRLMKLLEGVVHRDDATGKAARIEGYRVAGKTGTYELAGGTYADFVGAVPADDPRLVVLVGVDTSAQGYTGATIAAPAFARIARRILASK